MPKKSYQYSDETEEPFINIPQPKLYLYLLLVSLSILFAVFAIGYVSTRAAQGNSGVYLPPIFVINSVFLLAGSWMINKANNSYKSDNTSGYQVALIATFILTLIFLTFQILGWTYYFDVMMGNNIGIGKQYLYAISGLHFAHVVAGLPFLLLFIITAYRRMKEPVSVLIYFSDPNKLMRLELLTIYWHFLDILWLVLVLFFLVNKFI
jgi:cytochrome c oxidase subunit 3